MLQVEEEAKAVFNCLNTFENMVETDPSVAEQVGMVHTNKSRMGIEMEFKGCIKTAWFESNGPVGAIERHGSCHAIMPLGCGRNNGSGIVHPFDKRFWDSEMKSPTSLQV
eukprot:1136164-Pelagomonas_calceolata.AAC.5